MQKTEVALEVAISKKAERRVAEAERKVANLLNPGKCIGSQE